MDLGLRGRVALVTGSTRGLGRVIAEKLASEGVITLINGRNQQEARSVARQIQSKYKTQTGICSCNATDLQSIKSGIKGSMFFHEHIDILVNNIGNVEKFGGFTDLTDEDWHRCFDVTFMSVVRFTRESLPYLEKSEHGRIINISSLPSHQPGNYNHHYAASKAAVNVLTKQLASNLGSKRILVNAICPSTLEGGGWEQNIRDRAKRDNVTIEEARSRMRQEEERKSPLNKMGKLEDVANLVAYLASDLASFLTGHIYDVDGGITKGV